MKKYFLSLAICLIPTVILGKTIDQYTIRQKAMGGVSVATFGDLRQFAANPAKVGLLSDGEFKLVHFNLGINQDVIDSWSDIQAIQDESDESTQIEMLKDLVPLKIGVKNALAPGLSYTRANFGLSYDSFTEVSGRLKRKSAPTLELSGGAVSNLSVAFAKPMKIGKKAVIAGISPRYVIHNRIFDKVTGSDTVEWSQSEILRSINGIEDIEVDQYSLSGYAVDAGVLMPVKTKKSAGFHGFRVKNLISSLKGSKELTNETVDITTRDPFELSYGISVDTVLPLFKKVRVASDYNLISDYGPFFKRLHFGAEKKLSIVTLRAGVNQGYIGGGFGLNLWLLTLDYAYFGEELGENVGYNELLTHNFQIGLKF